MKNPDVVAGIDRDSDNGSDDPVIWKGLGPHGIYFETRRLGTRRLDLRALAIGDEGYRDKGEGEDDPLHGGLIISNRKHPVGRVELG